MPPLTVTVNAVDSTTVSPVAGDALGARERPTLGTPANFQALHQAVLELDPGESLTRCADEHEEVLFVLDGEGSLELGGEAHRLEPESGAYLAPGEQYAVSNTGDRSLKLISVRIPDPADPDPERDADPTRPDRAVVRRVADQQSEAATTDREFRIVADPETGLRSATHFVGYIPTARAPEHFHAYNEVIYVLDGEGVMHAEGNDWLLRPGTCIQLPARVVHCLENTGSDVMRVVAVFRPAGSPAAAYYPDGTPAHPAAPPLSTQSEPDSEGSPEEEVEQ
jgi:quercetin dioxygenase-like cupin family protein